MINEYVVVCVSSQAIPESFEVAIRKIFHDFKIEIQNIKRNQSLRYFTQSSDLNLELLNSSLMYLSTLHQIDIAFMPKSLFETKKKLVVFDMDSTLITAEVIDEIALKHGVGDQVKLITLKAMNGELDFTQSLTERVALLKGFPEKYMVEILKNLTFTPGTQEFIQKLKLGGIKTAIASGGFEYFANDIKNKLQMDYVFANKLQFSSHILTGKVDGSIIDAKAKENIVVKLAQSENLNLDQVVAIGDGANDIPMLLKAGLGIAIHAKEKVQKSAKFRINFGPMTSALSYMNLDN